MFFVVPSVNAQIPKLGDSSSQVIPKVDYSPPVSVNYSSKNVNNSDYLDGIDSTGFLSAFGDTVNGSFQFNTDAFVIRSTSGAYITLFPYNTNDEAMTEYKNGVNTWLTGMNGAITGNPYDIWNDINNTVVRINTSGETLFINTIEALDFCTTTGTCLLSSSGDNSSFNQTMAMDLFWGLAIDQTGITGEKKGSMTINTTGDLIANEVIADYFKISNTITEGSADLASAVGTGLDHYYNLDEASGNAIDQIGSADGTNTVGILQNQSGKNGTAYTYSKTNYTEIPLDVSAFYNGDFTINFWARADSIDGASYRNIVGFYAPNNDRVRISQVPSTGAVLFNWFGDNTAVTTRVLDATSWHMITAVHYANGSLRIYYDSILEGVDDTASTISTTDDFVYFAQSQGQAFFLGDLDEVGFWSRALNQTEINWLNESHTTPFGSYSTNTYDFILSYDGANPSFNTSSDRVFTFYNGSGLGTIRYASAVTSTPENGNYSTLENLVNPEELTTTGKNATEFHQSFPEEVQRIIKVTDYENCSWVQTASTWFYIVQACENFTTEIRMTERIEDWESYGNILSEREQIEEEQVCGEKDELVIDITNWQMYLYKGLWETNIFVEPLARTVNTTTMTLGNKTNPFQEGHIQEFHVGDMREYYEANENYSYPNGTIVCIDRDTEAEIYPCKNYKDRVIGVVADNSSYEEMDIAIYGKFETVRVNGTIQKGDSIIVWKTQGIGTSMYGVPDPITGENSTNWKVYELYAKNMWVLGGAMEDYNSSEIGEIKVEIGK